tara:strand:+ start:44 stop:517 length:474 start_codon:yes stop_codon:yes gene_type:complete
MKVINTRTIRGVLRNEQTLQLIENMLPNIGYRVIDFRVFPNAVKDLDVTIETYSACKLTTIGEDHRGPTHPNPPVDIDSFEFDKNSTVGMAAYVGGNQSNMIDVNMLITQDLYITNMEEDDKDSTQTSFIIVLEKLSINSDEQIMSLIQENSQDMSR